VTHNERRREQRPEHYDQVSLELNAGAGNRELSLSPHTKKLGTNSADPPCVVAFFCSKLKAPRRGTSFGPFVCGTRACLLCLSLSRLARSSGRPPASGRPSARSSARPRQWPRAGCWPWLWANSPAAAGRPVEGREGAAQRHRRIYVRVEAPEQLR
jgi:hypothetical protein